MKQEVSGKTKVFSTDKKFVRVLGKTEKGLIEFSFSIGEPELSAELILPEDAFKEFCETNKVILLSDEAPDGQEENQDWSWSLRDATHQRFK